MSSRRFPGKVLAPLAGKPVIAHVLSRICEAIPADRVILVTSDDSTDDPLASYVGAKLGFTVFRGSLDNVVARFQGGLRAHPAEWFLRICGDSPAIDPGLIAWMMNRVSPDVDLLTNVAKRTFPPGESVEIVRSAEFLGWSAAALAPDEREHVTLRFYRQPERYRIRNVVADVASLSGTRLVVDTLEDLQALQQIFVADPGMTRGYALHARLE